MVDIKILSGIIKIIEDFKKNELKKSGTTHVNQLKIKFDVRNYPLYGGKILMTLGPIIFTEKKVYVYNHKETYSSVEFDNKKCWKLKKVDNDVYVFEIDYSQIHKLGGKPVTGGNFFRRKKEDIGYLYYNKKIICLIGSKENSILPMIDELKMTIKKLIDDNRKIKNEEERLKKELLEKRKQESLTREKKERERISKEREDRTKYLLKLRDETIHNLDKDNNGLVDILEVDDFMKLLKKHQEKIIKINSGHITDFVKVSEHLSLKKDNIQIIFDRLKNTVDLQIEGLLELLNNQINIFNVLLFHSINMIGSLINNDLITYNEIYLKFDKLDVFNSNWENQVQSELISVNKGLVDVKNKLSEISKGVNTMNKNFRQLIYNVHQMEKNITSELSNLSYTIDYGVSELNSSLTRELKDINSGIGMNNLLTGIQTYQMYKINKNTKSLRG